MEVIKAAKKNPQFGVRRLADVFECGKCRFPLSLKIRSPFLSSTKRMHQAKVSVREKAQDPVNFQTSMKHSISGTYMYLLQLCYVVQMEMKTFSSLKLLQSYRLHHNQELIFPAN